MPHKLRKCRRNRGSRTCGYGKVGQHRDQGSKPNRKCGRHKHKWSYVIRYEPDYFSKRGFTSPRSLRQKGMTINVGRLEEIAGKLTIGKGESESQIDLGSLGYSKLLGAGKITRPINVRVASCSEAASEKVKGAGGAVLAEIEKEGE